MQICVEGFNSVVKGLILTPMKVLYFNQACLPKTLRS
jgi:hypothetical protein